MTDTDQRADTPGTEADGRLRTAAGRAAHWRWHGEQVCPADVGQECTVAGHIQSIEAEAAAQGAAEWRSHPANQKALAAAEAAADYAIEVTRLRARVAELESESAAAEPPDMTAAERNALIEKLAEDGSL